MTIRNSEIHDVSDTALWIAFYRAKETERADAIFKDKFASILVGKIGELIATRTQGSRYTAWSVVIRTYIIDQFILRLVAKNVDTIINLGAGLDTRPYRLPLPPHIRWIEVDFPNIILHKEMKLKNETPNCHLERINLDLENINERNIFFKSIQSEFGNVLVLTEGLIPYLSNQDVELLATDLFKHPNINYWITEFYSPEILDYLRTPKRLEQMKNSPFLFYPKNWFDFFKNTGWQEIETQYFGVESQKLGRTPPIPGWLKSQKDLDEKNKINKIKKFLGYTIFTKNKKLNNDL